MLRLNYSRVQFEEKLETERVSQVKNEREGTICVEPTVVSININCKLFRKTLHCVYIREFKVSERKDESNYHEIFLYIAQRS